MSKSGIDYFPFVCQPDDKLELIEAEFGLKGLAIIVKLFQRIYGENGYYCEWSKEVALLFSRKQCGLKLGDNVVSEVVNAAIKRQLFSEEKYVKYGILTSEGIQKRYLLAAKRRTSVEIREEYLLLKVGQIPKNVDIISENVYRNEENVYRNEQSKEKESKGKKSESDGASAPTPTPAVPNQAKLRRKYGEYGWVMLSDAEYDRLIQQYGESTVKYYIQYVDESAQVTGNKNKWKDWNLTIRKAIRNKWGGGPPTNNKNSIKSYDDDEDFLRK